MRCIFYFFIANSIIAGPIITFNDNGAWCWYQDERVIVHDNKLIIGSIASRAGTDGTNRVGDVEVVTHDISNGITSAPFTLHDNLQEDDHNLPAFIARPDGKVIAIYSRHTSDYLIRYRITTNPNDMSSWDAEQTVERDRKVCYSNIFQLSNENGRMYNFYRGENYYSTPIHRGLNTNYIYSDDNGNSWTYGGQLLHKDTERPYVKYASNNIDAIYFVTTEAHPDEYTGTSIYAGYFKNGHIYTSDGTDLGTGPVAPESLTTIYAGDSNHEAWTVDLHLDKNGSPYTVYTVQHNGDINDNRYRYARWDGTQWHDYELAYAGTYLYSTQEFYTGLVALDPHDPNRVFISTDVNPVDATPLISAADKQTHYEIFQGTTTNSGATWTWEPITANSTEDNLRPVMPIWDGVNSVLLWMRGTYSHYKTYDLDIVGMFNPEPLCKFMHSESYIFDSNKDCKIDLLDYELLSSYWLDCGLTPESACQDTALSTPLMIKEPLAHWPMDLEYYTENQYQDVVGNHHGIVNGNPTFTTGIDGAVNGAVVMNQTQSGYAVIGTLNPIETSSRMTISLAVQWAGSDITKYQGLVCKRDNSSNMMWQFMNNANNVSYVDFESQNAWNVISNPALVQGEWVHLAVTHDGTIGKLYINGLLADQQYFDMGSRTDSTLYLGTVGTDLLTGVFNGAIDEVKIFDDILGPDEIAQEYYNLTGKGICLNNFSFDASGPFEQPDCKINMYDLVIFIRSWMDSGQ